MSATAPETKAPNWTIRARICGHGVELTMLVAGAPVLLLETMKVEVDQVRPQSYCRVI